MMSLSQGITIFKALKVVGGLVDDVLKVAKDGRVTGEEVIYLFREVCKELGIELDETGFDIPDFKD